MASRVLSYEPKNTWIHRLSGVTKLLFFLIWSIVAMITYDTRVLAAMSLISLVIYSMAKIRWKQVAVVFRFILFFLIVNLIAIYLFSPDQGTRVYGSAHALCFSGRWTLTLEQLFYELNIFIKYMTVVPAVFMFIVTTNPSELASSMNQIGVHYNICYSLALALRYIPDMQDEFRKIRNAQEARGIEMSRKAKFMDRIRSMAAILFPLIFTSMDRIDSVSNAMELRGFGKHKKRTWYAAKHLERNDYLVLILTIVGAVAALVITFRSGSRFFNPFVQ